MTDECYTVAELLREARGILREKSPYDDYTDLIGASLRIEEALRTIEGAGQGRLRSRQKKSNRVVTGIADG